MQIGISVAYVVLCISAPWVARKWGWRGGMAWGMVTLGFLFSVILVLD